VFLDAVGSRLGLYTCIACTTVEINIAHHTLLLLLKAAWHRQHVTTLKSQQHGTLHMQPDARQAASTLNTNAAYACSIRCTLKSKQLQDNTYSWTASLSGSRSIFFRTDVHKAKGAHVRPGMLVAQDLLRDDDARDCAARHACVHSALCFLLWLALQHGVLHMAEFVTLPAPQQRFHAHHPRSQDPACSTA